MQVKDHSSKGHAIFRFDDETDVINNIIKNN